MAWIFFTLLAAFSQSWRNALQAKFSQQASTASVTMARFILGVPLSILYLGALYLWQPANMIDINGTWFAFILGASMMQIIATSLMVKLFKANNFAVGAGLAKSEALVAAVLGMLFFGSVLSFLGWIGVLVGAVAVMLLSGFTLKQFNIGTALLGLACGTCFALTSLWVREASLAQSLPNIHSAAWTLGSVLSLQTLILGLYLSVKEPSSWKVMWENKTMTFAISATSFIGSIGWFSAMSLEHVAYVKTLGQIEVFFTLIIAHFWLKSPTKKRDSLGLILIALAAILVILG